MGGPDLLTLRLLVQVAELGSVGQAARAAGMAQPSATKRLSALERYVGVPLLTRGPRGSVLTKDGRAVVGWSVQLLTAADEFQRSLAALGRDRAAQLRIAASMTVAEALLPGWLHQFGQTEPDVRVGLTVANSTEVVRIVLEDSDVDLGFVEGATVPRGLAQLAVGRDRLLVVVAPGHPWASRVRPLHPAELAATPLVLREAGSGTRETLERALRGHHRAPPRLTLGSNAAVKGAALAGTAPAVLSRYAVQAELASRLLVPVPVEDLPLVRTLRAVWPRGRPLNRTAMAVLRLVCTVKPDLADR